MISAEISLYPMETVDSDTIINESLKTLSNTEVSYDVGTLSTKLSGPPEAVWSGIKNVFDLAGKNNNEVAMVVTIANSTV